MALDGTQALLYDMGVLRLYVPNPSLRLGTGLAAGVGVAMLLVPLTNQALWRRPRTDQPVFSGWKDVAGVAAAQATLFALTLSNWPATLLPLSLFNSVAILTIVTALMTLVLVLIARRAGRFAGWHSAVGYFGGGFLLTALFIAVMAVARLAEFGPGPLG